MAKKKAKKKAAKKAAKKTKKVVAKKKKVAKKAVKKAPKKVKAKKSKAKKVVAKKAKAKVVKKAAKKAAPKKAAPKAVKAAPAAPAVTLPKLGTEIPAIHLHTDTGASVNLKDLSLKTKHFVLYLYPKDDTPGCTKEACDFRDNNAKIIESGASVAGVSPDGIESHQNFLNKYNLNFTLLSDATHELAEKLGAWKLKNFMGNSYMGVERSTYLFTDGILTKIWQPVKVEGHVNEVLEALKA